MKLQLRDVSFKHNPGNLVSEVDEDNKVACCSAYGLGHIFHLYSHIILILLRCGIHLIQMGELNWPC